MLQRIKRENRESIYELRLKLFSRIQRKSHTPYRFNSNYRHVWKTNDGYDDFNARNFTKYS